MPHRSMPSRRTLSIAAAIVVFAACDRAPPDLSHPPDRARAIEAPTAKPKPTASPTAPSPSAATPTRHERRSAGAMPELADKPAPRVETFEGCPPEGDGGDRELNRAKNRTDEASWIPVEHAALLHLSWPPRVERRDHREWSPADSAAVARYEGIPVVVEGYLAGAKEEGPESPNCHDKAQRDWHMWLVASPDDDRSRSIVVEATPRVRAKHPGWHLSRVKPLVASKSKVRISGFTMLDPEHPDQVGKTRGTIWEIHPILQIEVEHDGRFIPLDALSGR
jgi:hypothetical protein